jgi:hypothetical protein
MFRAGALRTLDNGNLGNRWIKQAFRWFPPERHEISIKLQSVFRGIIWGKSKVYIISGPITDRLMINRVQLPQYRISLILSPHVPLPWLPRIASQGQLSLSRI